MKKTTFENIKLTLEEISNGKLDIRVLVCFLISIREEKNISKFIREMGDFAAHPVRYKGETYEIVKSFIEHTMKFFDSENNILSAYNIPLMITQKKLIEEIKFFLQKAGFTEDDISKLNGSSYLIMRNIIEILDESSFDSADGTLKGTIDPRVNKCNLLKETEGDTERLLIQIFPSTDIIKNFPIIFGEGVSFLVPILEATPIEENFEFPNDLLYIKC